MKVLTSQKGPCYTSYVQMEVKEVYCKVHETAYLLVGTMMKAGGKVWFNPPFLWKCLNQVRVITVFPFFQLLTDFVCLYNYEFCLSLWKIVRSLVILLLPLITYRANICSLCQTHFDKLAHFRWIFSIWLSKFHAICTSWTNLTRLGHRASSFCHIPNIWM